MLVELPNGIFLEDHDMRFRFAAAPVLLLVAACSGTDSRNSARDVTDLTSVVPGKSPGAPSDTSTARSSPAAPSTTVPSTPSSSTGPGLSGLALISDDFSQYASTAALQNNISVNIGGTGNGQTSLYGDGHDAQLAELDQSVRYNGHATVKYNAPGGVSNIPGLWAYLPHPLSTMWFRAKIRFSPGFTTTGVLTNSSNAYKLLGWGYADSYGSGRVEITNTTQYQLYYGTLVSGTNTPNSTPAQFGIGGNVTTEWSDGGWYDYIIEYQNTSATTSVARLWMARDGSTPVLRATSTSTSLPGYTMPHIGYVMMGLNFNQVRAPNQSQALWYGQWEVVDGVQHPNPFGLAGNY